MSREANKEANDVFTSAFEQCGKEIQFNKSWSNGTGLFDFAVYGEHAPKLGNGEIVKSKTPGGRRILIIGTRLGNFAVYDRFKNQGRGEPDYSIAVFTYNNTSAIKLGAWFSQDYLREYEMELAVGSDYTREGNIGWRIEQLHSAMKDPKK